MAEIQENRCAVPADPQIGEPDVAVQNVNTNEVTEFSKMTVTTEYFYTEPQEGEDYHVSSKLVADTLVNLAAGEYRILNFGMYNRSGKPLEGDDVPDASADNRFTVSDNTLTTVKVPVTFTESSPQVKDGMILKKLWEALDGPNWRYTGRYHNKGCNWDFSRDVDLWVAQPGVTILDDGRVASINFSMFGAKGAIPEEEQLRPEEAGPAGGVLRYRYEKASRFSGGGFCRMARRIIRHQSRGACRHDRPGSEYP